MIDYESFYNLIESEKIPDVYNIEVFFESVTATSFCPIHDLEDFKALGHPNSFIRDVYEMLNKKPIEWFSDKESTNRLCCHLVEAYLAYDQFYQIIPSILAKLGTSVEEILNSNPKIRRLFSIDLDRFIKNQESDACGHEQALQEIKNGKKENHWIWWNFPQLEAVTRGLHRSWETGYFGIRSRAEAIAYYNNTLLRSHLIELCQAIIDSPKSVRAIFGNDWIKVKSCLNLFYSVEHNPIFTKVLSKL